ncbi:PEGA domain-containing protein [Candidatus Gottesmanbacteria bacterium]|nr:PEGA domain-containing protein [Candidatus Gottesmanbacteria bacterium]
MKRKFAFLLILVLLLAGIVGIVKLLRGRSVKQGEIRVESTVPAGIFVNDKHLGRTPFKDKINAGDYTIKLVPESTTQQFSSWQGSITVGPNLLTYINAALSESELSTAIDVLWLEKISAKNPELSVTTNPDGATVLVDDAPRGVTPLSLADIVLGDHSVTVTSPGFLARTLKIKITPGYRVIATIKLALSPGGSAQPATSPTPSIAVPGKTATSSATTPDPVKPFIIIKDTPTGFLRVRMEPSTSATESGRVKPGEKYHIEESQSGWYKIKYTGQNTGWISGQYAEKVE